MVSREFLVLSRRCAGTQVVPGREGPEISSKTCWIRFSASSTASTGGKSEERKEVRRITYSDRLWLRP